MPFRDELLDVARSLIRPVDAQTPRPPTLRRGVSTAYYALFHLLIHEAMARIIADPAVRTDLGRAINQEPTRRVCQQYTDATQVGDVWKLRSGEEIPEQLKQVGSAFVKLIEARYTADYDPRAEQDFPEVVADELLSIAEKAFDDFQEVQGDPATLTFLTRIFLESLGRRRT